MSFFDDYGLLNSREDEKNAENALLWTYELILLLELQNKSSEAHISSLSSAIDLCRVSEGIYHQNPSFAFTPPENAHDAYMSPDQLIAITGASYRYGWTHAEDVWKEIKRQRMLYDNVDPNAPRRWARPWDLAFYAICGGSKLAKLFMWLIAITCIVSCMSKPGKTSGKLLAFVKMNTLRDKSPMMELTWKICSKIIKTQYKVGNGWWKAFAIYFPFTDHPNNIESRKI